MGDRRVAVVPYEAAVPYEAVVPDEAVVPYEAVENDAVHVVVGLEIYEKVSAVNMLLLVEVPYAGS
jgi:hypothetical protein